MGLGDQRGSSKASLGHLLLSAISSIRTIRQHNNKCTAVTGWKPGWEKLAARLRGPVGDHRVSHRARGVNRKSSKAICENVLGLISVRRAIGRMVGPALLEFPQFLLILRSDNRCANRINFFWEENGGDLYRPSATLQGRGSAKCTVSVVFVVTFF